MRERGARATNGPGQCHSREGGHRHEREPAEARRDVRRLSVGDHDGDHYERRERRQGAGREAPGGRGEVAAGQRDQPRLCGDERGVGRHERDHGLGRGARRRTTGGRSERRRPAGASASARWRRSRRITSVVTIRSTARRRLYMVRLLSASAPSKALGEEIVHARGGRVIGRG